MEASAWAPVVGDAGHLAGRLRTLLADGYRVVLAADGRGSATRMTEALAEEGVELALVLDDGDDGDGDGAHLARPGGHAVVASSTGVSSCRLPAWPC